MFINWELPDELVNKIVDQFDEVDKKNYALVEKYSKKKFNTFPSLFFKASKPKVPLNFGELIIERGKNFDLLKQKEDLEKQRDSKIYQYISCYRDDEQCWPALYTSAFIGMAAYFRDYSLILESMDTFCRIDFVICSFLAALPALPSLLQVPDKFNELKKVMPKMHETLIAFIMVTLNLTAGFMELGFELPIATLLMLISSILLVFLEKNTILSNTITIFFSYFSIGTLLGLVSGILTGALLEPVLGMHSQDECTSILSGIGNGIYLAADHMPFVGITTGITGFVQALIYHATNQYFDFDQRIKNLEIQLEDNKIVGEEPGVTGMRI